MVEPIIVTTIEARQWALRERFKDQSRDELELYIWKLELQNKALLEVLDTEQRRSKKRLKSLKKANLCIAQLSREAHGG